MISMTFCKTLDATFSIRTLPKHSYSFIISLLVAIRMSIFPSAKIFSTNFIQFLVMYIYFALQASGTSQAIISITGGLIRPMLWLVAPIRDTNISSTAQWSFRHSNTSLDINLILELAEQRFASKAYVMAGRDLSSVLEYKGIIFRRAESEWMFTFRLVSVRPFAKHSKMGSTRFSYFNLSLYFTVYALIECIVSYRVFQSFEFSFTSSFSNSSSSGYAITGGGIILRFGLTIRFGLTDYVFYA